MSEDKPFVKLRIAVMTISDTRTEEDDTAGETLVNRIVESGHVLVKKIIVPDNKYEIRALASKWIADDDVQVILSTGGTGLTGRDVTPEAFSVLFDKTIDGFGELFRSISYQFIKTSTMQSRALAGIANGTVIFCLPGSPGACKDGWDEIIRYQLDVNHGPCNLVEIMPRLKEV